MVKKKDKKITIILFFFFLRKQLFSLLLDMQTDTMPKIQGLQSLYSFCYIM